MQGTHDLDETGVASGVDRLGRSFSRRSFLAGLATLTGSAALAACGGGTEPAQSDLSLSRIFDPRTLRTDGSPQRLVWAMSDLDGYLTSTAAEEVFVTAKRDETVILDRVRIPVHGDGMLVPYYPVIMAFEDSAPVEVTFETPAGSITSFVDARAADNDGLIGIGDQMPAVATPLTTDTRGADPLCTRSPEPCSFHSVSLDDALADGRPAIVNISTPAFCSNQIACGPVLEILIDESPNIPSDVAIIHAEVYTAPTGRDLGPIAPLMEAVGMWYEPALFVIDEAGTVVDRLDFLWDRTELRRALEVLA